MDQSEVLRLWATSGGLIVRQEDLVATLAILAKVEVIGVIVKPTNDNKWVITKQY